jgi:hypothetical protein
MSGLVTFGVFGIALLFQGCVTPIEIKNASKAQLQLIDSMDSAVADLQAALTQFHRDKEARIIEEGSMLIARQAIDVAISYDKGGRVTADQLYNIYKKNIQPWVEYWMDEVSFSSSVDERIRTLQKQIEASKNATAKGSMEFDLQDLKELQANLGKKPEEVKELETHIQADLKDERSTASKTREMLEILRAQVALMKEMQAKVDAWLAIDLTVTQEQADALKKLFSSANQGITGGAR